MEALIPAPDPKALQREAEARRGKYLHLPWLGGEGEQQQQQLQKSLPPQQEQQQQEQEGGQQPPREQQEQAQQSPRQQEQQEGDWQGVGVGGGAEEVSGFSPFARVAMVDGWASLRAAEAVRVLCFCLYLVCLWWSMCVWVSHVNKPTYLPPI